MIKVLFLGVIIAAFVVIFVYVWRILGTPAHTDPFDSFGA